MLIQIPPQAVICHYAQTAQGLAVVTPFGKVLGQSFYALRDRFEFYASINGAGAWVVIVPRGFGKHEQASQARLF